MIEVVIYLLSLEAFGVAIPRSVSFCNSLALISEYRQLSLGFVYSGALVSVISCYSFPVWFERLRLYISVLILCFFSVGALARTSLTLISAALGLSFVSFGALSNNSSYFFTIHFTDVCTSTDLF